MTRLFGTDGVRGVANRELTPELALKLGEAAGRFLGDRGRGRIIVGRDTRRSGEMLETALVAGITAGGGDALLAGVVPTPAVAHLVREVGADGGVVISASHNPPEYNGIKFFSRTGFKLPDDLEDEIEAFCISGAVPERPVGAGIGRCMTLTDAADRYVQHALDTIDVDLEGMRIAVDCGHGAASVATPEALRQLGAKVIAVNCDWNGMDINVDCGSTDLRPLQRIVSEHDVDFGIAHDGDADRVIAVDETGAEVDGDMVMAFSAVRLKQMDRLPGDTVVSTVMANLGFDVAMKAHGINVVKTQVGDRYVLEEMQAMGAALGGEQSGHVIFLDHNTTGDGLVTALQIAAAIRESGMPLSELRRTMRRYPQVMVNVAVSDKTRLTTSAAVAEAIAAAEAELGETGRILVRASGTEPLVRVMAEAETEQAAEAVVEKVADVVETELS